MGTLGWIGVGIAGWCLLSCVAAVVLGRAIRASDNALRAAEANRQMHAERTGGFIALDRDQMHVFDQGREGTG